jgi:hypothetical protein
VTSKWFGVAGENCGGVCASQISMTNAAKLILSRVEYILKVYLEYQALENKRRRGN